MGKATCGDMGKLHFGIKNAVFLLIFIDFAGNRACLRVVYLWSTFEFLALHVRLKASHVALCLALAKVVALIWIIA